MILHSISASPDDDDDDGDGGYHDEEDDDDDDDGVGLWKVGFYNSPESAVCPRRIHCVLPPW